MRTDLPRAYRVLFLLFVLALGIGLRAYRLDWGLPHYSYADGLRYFTRPAARMVGLGELIPAHFVHPPLLTYLTAGLFAGYSMLAGEPIAPAGQAFYAQLPTLTFLGRALSVTLTAASIVLVYIIGRRLFGTTAGLLAAAAFAVTPLHVLEAHRVNPDVPLILLMLIVTYVALRAHEQRSAGRLLLAFFLSGLAGGVKYTGPSVGAVPAWLALRWHDAEPWRARVARVAAGMLVAVAGVAIGCLPVLLHWEKAWQTVSAVVWYSYVIGMPGVDLAGQSWTYVRYVYALVVGLPYMMGWPVYLAALAGIVRILRQKPEGGGIILAFVVPYFLIMGGAMAVVARYYLPLVPYLALAAGAALAWGWEGTGGRRALAVLLTTGVLGYTFALSLSQCMRLGLGPQRQVAHLIGEQVRATPGETAVVAYPSLLVLEYDAVQPLLRQVPDLRIVPYPPWYQNVRVEPLEVPSEHALVARERGWLDKHDVDAVILPSWIENGVMRERPAGATAAFYEHLGSGDLGFRLAGDFRTRYWTQGLYTWGDPMLDTHWETAITGYKVFVRDAAGAEGSR